MIKMNNKANLTVLILIINSFMTEAVIIWTGLCMITASVMKELITFKLWFLKKIHHASGSMSYSKN